MPLARFPPGCWGETGQRCTSVALRGYSIDPDYLEGVATLVIKQRIGRREAESGLVLNALFRYTPRGRFFAAYHQEVSVRQFGRMG
ncbi:hypothetical protein, partial [Streptomyces lutosisoli]|uniref:hypothetical protein n=1 Tax=Streptomyces lutosisoli TaxID=2665721 RepID=UPI0036151640